MKKRKILLSVIVTAASSRLCYSSKVIAIAVDTDTCTADGQCELPPSARRISGSKLCYGYNVSTADKNRRSCFYIEESLLYREKIIDE